MALRDRGIKVAARARAKSMTQWPLLIVLGVACAGLLLVWIGHWRWGASIVGAAMCLGGVERVVLPRRTAGLLQVRSRTFDLLVLFGSGIAIIGLALLVPGPR